MCKDLDVEMAEPETVKHENKEKDVMTDATKPDVEKSAEDKGDAKNVKNFVSLSGFGTQFFNISSNISLTGVLKDSVEADVSSLLDIHIQQETPQIQSPSVQKVPISVILETTNLPPILEILTETPASTTVSPPQVTPTISIVQQTTTQFPIPPITTESPTIITAVPESDAFTAVQLRVAKLEKDVSEHKNINLSAEALATLKSQAPNVVDDYLGSKLVNLEQGSEKNASEILKIKMEQAEKQNMPKYTIKSIDKATLKEYDQKSALYQTMHENKSFNRNPVNHKLYRALMEALIKDENVMDKGVTNTIKDHKRKHDDDDVDDDEDPPAGPNQGKAPSKGSKIGKSVSAKESVKELIAEVVMDDAFNTACENVVRDDDQPQDTSEPKTDKTPNLEWFKQPLRPPTPDPECNKRQVVLGQPEQPWFNQMVSVTKDPLTFNDLMATPIDFSKYVLDRLKIDNLTQDLLLGPAYNLLKGTCTSSIKLEYNFQECFNALIDKLDWNNPEGDRYPFDVSKPLPLQGYPDHLTVAADYFFNNDLEYLKSSDLEKTYTTSITKTKATRYEIVGIEDMVPTLWGTIKHAYDKDAAKEIKHYGERRKLCVKKLHGYGHLGEVLFHLNDSDIVDFIVALCMFTRSLVIKHRVEDLQLGVESYHKKLNITAPQQTFPEIEFKELYTPSYKPPGDTPRRKWTAIDKKRSELMVELIDKHMRERRIIRNLERLVDARELKMDCKT
ncbi:hypothetical protein Tco_0414844 [Tanacetum coccineum]